METMHCDKCEGATDTLTRGLCEYCYADYLALEERGELFTWGENNPCFVGYDTGRKWNGWEVPEFNGREICQIFMYSNTDFLWEGDTVKYEDETGEWATLTRNSNGRFVFDGVCWDKVEIVGDENANHAFTSIEKRLKSELLTRETWQVLDAFRDELLDTWALEVQFIGAENAERRWSNLHTYLTAY